MCFDHDSRPPIAPIAGGALDSMPLVLTAADRNRFAAFRARASEPSGAGVVILPDVRGLHPYYEELALRFAEHGIDALALDWFGRTAGPEPRGDDFDYSPTSGPDDLGRHPERHHRRGRGDPDAGGRPGGARIGVHDRASAWVAGCRSWPATLGLGLAGVIGMYGTLAGPWRNDAPAPVDVAGQIASPVLGLFGGADTVITPEAIDAFDHGLEAAGVDHRLVTYPGAPHSFFDRKAADFADESAAAWNEVLAFIRARTA